MKNLSSLDTTVLESYRKIAEQAEHSYHPKAAFSKDHHRLFIEDDDYRLPYKRDVDRIVHSKAYARYSDKTQVVYLVENDHISHRNIHVQLVSSFARGIGEILRYNLDLIEAIALGHDVGHPPFGHEGEGYLSELSLEHGNGSFTHSWQSCRLFIDIEPLNLGLAVYDGFLCHDGGMRGQKLIPTFDKTWEIHFSERNQKINDPEGNIWPGTLEGCLVKICDTISYLARDIEDAISLGILKREGLPDTLLGKTSQSILDVLAQDIIVHSHEKDYLTMSEESYEALKVLRKFNFERIYVHPKLKIESNKVKRSYRILFEYLLRDLEKRKKESYVWQNFGSNKSERYLAGTGNVQMVVDYIAGMTDSYFIRTLQKLVLPNPIELF